MDFKSLNEKLEKFIESGDVDQSLLEFIRRWGKSYIRVTEVNDTLTKLLGINMYDGDLIKACKDWKSSYYNIKSRLTDEEIKEIIKNLKNIANKRKNGEEIIYKHMAGTNGVTPFYTNIPVGGKVYRKSDGKYLGICMGYQTDSYESDKLYISIEDKLPIESKYVEWKE